jgi:cyanophycin synthetase
VGLDVAGIDIVAVDVGRPLEEQGGVVVEVNAGPGLGLHLPPWCDPPRPVADAIVGLLFPEGQDGRIPIIAVVGEDAGALVKRLGRLLGNTGKPVGTATADGVFVGSRRISPRDGSGFDGAWRLLRNPFVEVAVLEASRGAVRTQGLAFDRARVVVVLDLAAAGVVERTLVRSLAPDGVAVLCGDRGAMEKLAAEAPRAVFAGPGAEAEAVLAALVQEPGVRGTPG